MGVCVALVDKRKTFLWGQIPFANQCREKTDENFLKESNKEVERTISGLHISTPHAERKCRENGTSAKDDIGLSLMHLGKRRPHP